MNSQGAVFQPELIEVMKSVLEDAAIMLPEAKRTSGAFPNEIAQQLIIKEMDKINRCTYWK